MKAQTYSSSPPKRMPRPSSIGCRLVDLNDLTPTVVPTVLADGVRQLHSPALGTGRIRRCRRLPVGATVPGLGPRVSASLGTGIVVLLRAQAQVGQAGPTGVDGLIPPWPQSVALRSAPQTGQSPAQSGLCSGKAGRRARARPWPWCRAEPVVGQHGVASSSSSGVRANSSRTSTSSSWSNWRRQRTQLTCAVALTVPLTSRPSTTLSTSASTVTAGQGGTEATAVAMVERGAHHDVLVRPRLGEQLTDVDRERRCCDVLAHD